MQIELRRAKQKVRWVGKVGKSELWEKGGDLYNKATGDGSRIFASDCIFVK